MDHTDRTELTPANIAQLDQNWSHANQALDDLLALNQDHRGAGCRDWFCGGEELADALNALEPHKVQLVLRAALERLTEPAPLIERMAE